MSKWLRVFMYVYVFMYVCMCVNVQGVPFKVREFQDFILWDILIKKFQHMSDNEPWHRMEHFNVLRYCTVLYGVSSY
jgi:hypothetical protein